MPKNLNYDFVDVNYIMSKPSMILHKGFIPEYHEGMTDMRQMFNNCHDLTSLDVSSNFDTSKVKNMNGMFLWL